MKDRLVDAIAARLPDRTEDELRQILAYLDGRRYIPVTNINPENLESLIERLRPSTRGTKC